MSWVGRPADSLPGPARACVGRAALSIVLVGLSAWAGEPDGRDHRPAAAGPEVEFLGAWQTNAAGACTLYPGSQVRFRLSGQARVRMHAGGTGTTCVALLRDGVEVFRGAPEQLPGLAAATSAVVAVVYTATTAKGYDPADTHAGDALLYFDGVESEPGALVRAEAAGDRRPKLAFIGDSILAGVHIHGRNGAGLTHSDASLTFAFRLCGRLGADGIIRGYPGATARDLVARVPFFQSGQPLERRGDADVVFINIGANERRESEADYAAAVSALVTAVRQDRPGVRVVLLDFFRMRPDRLKVLRRLTEALATPDVVCFDARPYLVGYSDEGVHPDVESHRRLAEALEPFVRQLLSR